MRLVLLRHGQSVWNKKNIFTGWTDVGLSKNGFEEAKKAGLSLKKNGFEFDIAYTSYLRRAIETLWVVLDKLDEMYIPVEKSWRLNERHYGALQGMNKNKVLKELGETKFKKIRRGFSTKPPLLKYNDVRHPHFDKRYKEYKPNGESLKNCMDRVMPYWNKHIQSQSNKTVLISAHGNSLRALVKYLENISNKDISKVEIPTGKPLVYDFNSKFKITNKYYLK